MASSSLVKCVLLHGSETGTTSRYSETSVSIEDPIFSAPPPPTLFLWELPLVIRQENPSQQGNQHVTWLMIDPSSGLAPPQWQGGIGDAIVARQDGKDLSAQLLGVIIDYVSLLLDAFGDGGSVSESWLRPLGFRKYVLKELPQLKQDDIRSNFPTDWTPKPSPSPLLQAKALKTAGGEHFASHNFSAARSKYVAAKQLISKAYPYERAMEDDEIVALMHILGVNIAIACIKLDDPKHAITEADIATHLHPLSMFSEKPFLSNKTKAKAYYTLGVAKMNSKKLGAKDLGARKDLLKALELAPDDAAIQKALQEVDA